MGCSRQSRNLNPVQILQRDLESLNQIRDLYYPNDFDKIRYKNNIDRINKLKENFTKALKIKKCENPEEIELHFAIMEIEAWLLAFSQAVAKWCRTDQESVERACKTSKFEEIPRPSVVLKQLAENSKRESLSRDQINQKKSKSFEGIISLVSTISRAEIHKVLLSQNIPSFNRFWEKIT